MARAAQLPPPDIVSHSRAEFLRDYWDYKAGEMTTILAPTGGGKTELSFDLLGATIGEKLPAVILVMKPRDSTVSRFQRRYKLAVLRDWPPPKLRFLKRVWGEKPPPGWVLWPTETDDPDRDDARHETIFRRCIRWCYKRGPVIIFADETYSLEHELKLERDLRRIWTKGRSMKCGLWAASQRPVWISRWALQGHHLFLGYDPDRKMQERYAEIGGGLDPEVIRWQVARLKAFEFLYINRDQRTMCVVRAS